MLEMKKLIKKSIGYVTGTFDPPTIGHLEVIERASTMFKKVYVVILINPDKITKFNIEDRLKMLKAMTAKFKNVKCDFYGGYAADYAKKHGLGMLVRGIRNEQDDKYEKEMASYNEGLGVSTVFLLSQTDLADVSSTRAKELIGICNYSLVPPEVARIIKEIYGVPQT